MSEIKLPHTQADDLIVIIYYQIQRLTCVANLPDYFETEFY